MNSKDNFYFSENTTSFLPRNIFSNMQNIQNYLYQERRYSNLNNFNFPQDKNKNKNYISHIDSMKNKEKPEIMNNINLNFNTKKSDEVICPECKKECKAISNGYNIRTICDSNESRHESNYTIFEFDQTQNKNEEILTCAVCNKKEKEEMFFYCFDCKENLCNQCINLHSNNIDNISHIVPLYVHKRKFCEKHFEKYNFYCNNCKVHLCTHCKKDHKKHCIEFYGNKHKDINRIYGETSKKLNELKDLYINIIKQIYIHYESIVQTSQLILEKNKEYCENITKETFMNQKLFNIDYLNKDFFYRL